MRHLYLIFFGLLLLSCGKDDPIIIDGNTPPPDYTIEEVSINTYINKLYISMLGREANEGEFLSAKTLLGTTVDMDDREALVSEVQEKEEYPHHLFKLFCEDYLQAIDTMQIREEFIELYKNLVLGADNIIEEEILQESLDRLNELYVVGHLLADNSIDAIEAQRRCAHNVIYDEINMGTENYVVSIYQNFLHRYPSDAELEAATLMVDGEQSNCFGSNGDSKAEFNTAFFAHDGYYEGQVISVFNKLLFRSPDSEEASFYAAQYKNHRDYAKLQRALLVSDEFIGIE
jgi:hypothetical protein